MVYFCFVYQEVWSIQPMCRYLTGPVRDKKNPNAPGLHSLALAPGMMFSAKTSENLVEDPSVRCLCSLCINWSPFERNVDRVSVIWPV